ncbi:MAG TPA: ATP-binding protein [Candidatus Xenobia bacterium]|nr:ATP-binding protein [Candidatus Xenobia bacterium]
MRIGYEGVLESADPAWAKVLGWTPAELVGKHFLDFIHPEDQSTAARELQRLREGEPSVRFENRFRSSDGAYRTFSWVLVRLEDRPAFYAVAHDETDRLRLEKQFHQAQKMEAMGRLAAGIAHDFNNLLGVILGFSELLRDRVAGDGTSQNYVEQIHKAGQSAAHLTRQLLAYSRRQALVPQVLCLNTVLSNMRGILRRLIGEDVELLLFPAANLGRVKVDRGQIEQVILNLAANAREAMPQGGTLTIETANATLDDSYSRSHPAVGPGSYVMLTVSDTGLGMDATTQARVFEPFFTTKQQGSGLGLATVYGIVKQSGGFVWVYSEPGKGTTFKIYFPQTQEELAGRAPEVVQPAKGGAETILLVEDSESLRSLTQQFLKEAGYRVLEAGGPAEALRIAQHNPDPIHLLVTDVVLPGGSGKQLADQLTRLSPTTKVLYVSGFTDNVISHHGVLNEGIRLLSKPFSRGDLLLSVRQALDSPVDVQ